MIPKNKDLKTPHPFPYGKRPASRIRPPDPSSFKKPDALPWVDAKLE